MNSDTTATQPKRMMSAAELLETQWTPKSRPSLQWLRQHTGKDIPAVKIGRLYFYDPEKVREALSLH